MCASCAAATTAAAYEVRLLLDAWPSLRWGPSAELAPACAQQGLRRQKFCTVPSQSTDDATLAGEQQPTSVESECA